MNILVTGGAGFIGSHLCEKLCNIENTLVVAVDDLSTGHPQKLSLSNPNLRFIKADVNNRSEISEIMMSWRFDYVFHYAAVVGVKRTLNNPLLVLKDIEGIKHILELCKNTGVKRIFFSSSSEIYGEPVEFPQNEDTTPLNSRLPYAIVKNVAEAYIRSYKTEYNLDYTIFRFFNTYGSKQSQHFVISKFIKQALTNQPITIYGDGHQSRTFCYIDDNVDATINALLNNLFINDVVNIGSDVETEIIDLAKLIIQLTGSKSEIIHFPPLKEGDMKARQPDINKMKRLLNRQLLPLEQGIKKILEEGLFELKYLDNNEND